ncbi:DNA damage-binding protein CMR1-like [Hordeum vulgare subsp. vulgare]|uniref:WD repeat-containing protein 76 n=1 Tax=Hordeum vulgare subsp. vulgare TaxID=112509 RepID=A0A8I6WZ39_HORVV|nr:DNA damage-binding protein CMR1-like [Hordeum vulgare subsp. vulgare]XP_044967572.1 DNA damage-binding protein CMR1-like [Hordeum vulgare subsp. vulgare]
MASRPAAGLTDYERLREENIRRNEAILASLRRKADELSAAIKTASKRVRPSNQPRKKPAAKTSPGQLRRSLRLSQPPPSHSPDAEPTPAPPPVPRSTSFASSLASSIIEAVSLAPPAKVRADDFDAGKELVLTPANVRKVVPDRILGVRVLPLLDRTVVAAGNKLGNIGFWDVDGMVEDEDDIGADGVFQYLPHRGPVPAIVAHPAAPQKIYSCSYEGEICLMDLEKESFNMIQLCDYPVYSLCQAPDSPSCLYFGDGNGELKLLDERMGKVSATWDSHDNTINSIDFHPEKKHMLATSSTDRTARIWDLRRLKRKKEESLKVLKHNRSVQSAYFSPSGLMLATTSLDDTVRVFCGDDFDRSHSIKHNNQTGRWISTFKAIWGWNDVDLFIGNMKRAIDIISLGGDDSSVSASNSACLESEHMTAIPCRFSAHPYKVGHLACASSGGKVFFWTRA